jgi:hypothetical protein
MRRPNLALASVSVCRTKRKTLVVLWWEGTGPSIFPGGSRRHRAMTSCVSFGPPSQPITDGAEPAKTGIPTAMTSPVRTRSEDFNFAACKGIPPTGAGR